MSVELHAAGLVTDDAGDTRRWVHRGPDGRLYELVQAR